MSYVVHSLYELHKTYDCPVSFYPKTVVLGQLFRNIIVLYKYLKGQSFITPLYCTNDHSKPSNITEKKSIAAIAIKKTLYENKEL